MRQNLLCWIVLCFAVGVGHVAVAQESAVEEPNSVAPSVPEATIGDADPDAVPVSLVTKAAEVYGEERWPGSRILSVTPYYAFDGSVNAWAVQFVKNGSSLATEAQVNERVRRGEEQLAWLRGSRPKPPEEEPTEAMAPAAETAVPVFENMSGTTAGIRVVFSPEAMAAAQATQQERIAYRERVAAWRRDVRAAANAAVLPDEVGTVMIAARYDLYPLLERFDGVAPHHKFQEKVRRLADVPDDQPVAVARSFYVGPMAYFFEPATGDGMSKATPDRVVHPLDEKIFDFTVRKATGDQGRLGAADLEKCAVTPTAFWDSIEKQGISPKTAAPTLSASPTFPIEGVPYYHQDDYGPGCCGPNASAQALGYWDDNGYGILVDNGRSDTGHEEELIYDLMKAQQYNPSVGTYGSKIAPGVKAVCNNAAYGNNLNFNSWEIKPPSWGGDIKGEIIHRRPFVYFNWKTNSYPNWAHFTTGMGYNETSGHLLYVNYNYTPDTPYELNWDNISSTNESMYPVHPGGPPMFDTIWTEDFEDPFLNEWTKRNPGTYPSHWWTTSYRAHNSTPNPSPPPSGNPAFSAWCHPWFGSPPGPYASNMDSMIILGPFSTYKTFGELSAYIWRHIPDTNGDAVALMASLDGSGFSGTAYYGDVRSWQRLTLDFSNVYGQGNILNKPNVWVGIWFVTDGDGPTGEGAYVDDVVVRLEPAIHFDVSAPTKGAKWQKGTQHDITWRSLGDMGLGGVTIELYRGLTLETTISNVTPNDGTFTWTVPTWVQAASNYQIKVFDTNAPTEWGYSPFFEIMDPPSLTLIAPNGGEVLGRGLTASIHWSSKGYPGQSVRLQLKKGTNLSTIVSSTPNDGWYAWPIPASQAAGTDYKLRILSLQNTAINDESNGLFSIQEPSLSIIRPFLNQMWIHGQTYDIRWTYVGNPGRTVLIELLRQTSTTLELDHVIAAASTASSGARSWTILPDQEPGDNYIIRITSNSDPSYTDTSDVFSIIAEPSVHLIWPNGGEWLERGTTHTLYWKTELPAARPIRLRLYRGPGGLIPPFLDSVIADSIVDDGSFDWFIPENQAPGDQYRVRVTLATTDSISDWSDDFFRIMGPAVEVMAPGNNDVWLAGTTRTIVWKTTDMPPSEMKIELIRRSAGPMTIAAAAPDTGLFAWGIPVSIPPETGCRIRVSPVVKPSTTGYSFGTFSIAHEPGIFVTSPQPGEAWNRGARQMIQWSQIGIPETDVRVELYRGDTFDSLITTAPLYANSCAWRIPESTPTGSDYRIRVVSLWDESYSGFNESFFSIDPETAVRESRWPLY